MRIAGVAPPVTGSVPEERSDRPKKERTARKKGKSDGEFNPFSALFGN